MATLGLKAYEIFKSKLGLEEAEVGIEYIQNSVEKSVEHNVKSLATKEDTSKLKEKLTITKSDLRSEIMATKAELNVELANGKFDLLRAVYVVGFVQFLVIVGSVIAIINLLAK